MTAPRYDRLMLSRLLSSLFVTQRRPKRQLAARRALLESLEDRRLLAVTSIQAFDGVSPVIGQVSGITNDNQLPIAINTPHPNALADITIYSDGGAGPAVQQYENIGTDAAGVARIVTPVLADGDYLVRARAGIYAKYFFICSPGLAEFEAEGSLVFTVDATPPRTTASTALLGPTNATLIPFTVTFAEPVTGFQASDAIVTNGTIDSIAANNVVALSAINAQTSFTVFVRPTAAGIVTLRVPQGAASDAAANLNTASNVVSVRFDPTSPVLTSVKRQPVTNGITNADTLIFRATFSEDVVHVDASDFQALGTTGTVTKALQMGPRVVDLTVSGGNLPALNGPVGLAVDSGNDISDMVGNPLSARPPAISQRYFLDNTAPTVQIIAAVAGTTTNAASVPVTFRFSEPVNGFSLSDVLLTNATASNLTGSGAVYRFTLTPQADGRVTVRVPAGVATDAAGNDNVASLPLSFISDRTRPTVRLSTTAVSPTNLAAIPVVARFSEAVRGLAAGDVTITGGTISGFTGSGATYRFNVVPTGNGRVTVAIGSAVATDFAGNANFASNGLSLVTDRTSPAVEVTPLSISPTNLAAISFRIVFSQRVLGFTSTDVVITNGTISGFSGSGDTYRLQVVPTADGPVTVRVPAGAANDAAGNDNFASNTASVISDRTRPTAVLSTTIVSPTNDAPVPVRLQFSEAVTGFSLSDLSLTNGSASDLTGSGNSYRFLVRPLADGVVRVGLPGGVVRDAAGNLNFFATPLTIVSDRTRPATVISTSSARPTNADLIPFHIQFSEPVNGFAGNDIAISNGTLNSISGGGASYDILVSPSADGLVTVNVPAAVAKDAAGNNNRAATPVSVRSDRIAPIADVTSPSASPTNGDVIPFRVAFDEPVAGFSQSDINIANGDIQDFIPNADGSFTVNVAPNGDGQVTLTVPADSGRDAAGNGNIADSFSVISDRTPPQVVLTYNAPPAGARNLGTVTIQFTEPVTGFDLADLSIQFPEVQFPLDSSMLSGSGDTYTLDLTKLPSQPGQHSLRLTAAGSDIFDEAGNALQLDGFTTWVPVFGNP